MGMAAPPLQAIGAEPNAAKGLIAKADKLCNSTLIHLAVPYF
jgi:hypothetical protein